MPLDEDYEHATYDADQVATYFAAATQAALVLAEFRAPFRGRSTPVNAWWGTFDLAVNFFSGRPADPPSDDFIMRNGGDAEQVAIGWWPGDPNHEQAAFFAFAYPAPDGFGGADLSPAAGALGRDARRVRARLGRRPGRAAIRTPQRWNSAGQHSATPARCASGIPLSRPRQREFHRRFGEARILVVHVGRRSSGAGGSTARRSRCTGTPQPELDLGPAADRAQRLRGLGHADRELVGRAGRGPADRARTGGGGIRTLEARYDA